MASITWLHLSDWHEGMESYDKDAIRYDREVVRDVLIEDIRDREEISRDLSRIDFIVFSGDLAYSGKAHEYEKARENFLDKVLDVTELKPERLFIVPGNHDVDRSIIENEHFLRDLKISERKFPDLLKGSHNLNVLLKPFEAFKEFVINYTKLQNPDYASILLENINTKKIALLGINSALMAGRKEADGKINDQGKLMIGEPQIHDGLKKIKESDIRIVVLHHPFEWINDFDNSRIEQYLRNFDFILCGHRHKAKAIETRGIGGGYVIIAAGASYDSRDYPNGYNFVHFDPENAYGRVYLRRWDGELGRWINAPFLNDKVKMVYSGCYDFRHSSRLIVSHPKLDEDQPIKLNENQPIPRLDENQPIKLTQ